jgi:hypothetical protein
MLLAEAASCHHVLTMVLGEPAEVDGDLRQRMYALAQSPAAAPQMRVEPAHHAMQPAAPVTSTVVAAAPAAAAPLRARIDPDEAAVPDYILAAAREQRRRSRRMTAAFVAAMLIGGGAVYLFWPQGEVQVPDQIAKMGGAEQASQGFEIGESKETKTAEAAEASQQGAGDETASKAEGSGEAPPFSSAGAAPAVAAAAAESTSAQTNGTESKANESPGVSAPAASAPDVTAPATSAGPTAATETSAALPAAAETTVAAAAAGGSAPAAAAAATQMPTDSTSAPVASAPEAGPVLAAPPAEGPEMKSPSASDVATTNVAPPAAAATMPSAETPAAPGTADGKATPQTPTPLVVTPAPPTPPGTETPVAEAGASESAGAAKPKPVGAYLGNGDLLLQFDPSAAVWKRLPPRTAIVGGEQLLALPAFRTHVVLADVNAYLNDGAEIDVIPPAKLAGEPKPEFGLRVPYGQVILNSGLNGNRVELSLVDEDRVVQLGPSSSLAIDVDRVFEPGGTATRGPAPAVVTWFLSSGTVSWGDGKTAEGPATWTTVRGQDTAPAAIDKLPEWVDRETITENERRARDRLAEAIVPGQPADTPLLEMSDPSGRGRRTEDRTLAAYAGAYVGRYDALVRMLADVTQRPYWNAQIEALRQAIARDPSAVEGIRRAFALERGEQAANDLMEMLLGFDSAAVGTTRDTVKAGALLRLLRWMDDDDLTKRVLASYNVNEITGTKDLGGYRPEHTAQQRKRELRFYWNRLESGELMPKQSQPPQEPPRL